MKIYFSVLLVLASLALSHNTFACSCGGPMEFTNTLEGQFDPDNNSDIVDPILVRAKVVSYESYAMNIEIKQNLLGKLEKNMIRVWGDNGMQCRPSAKQFPIGTEWVLLIKPNSDEGDYATSACGVNYLQVIDGKVTGNIQGVQKESMGMSKFEQIVNSIAKKAHDDIETKKLAFQHLKLDCSVNVSGGNFTPWTFNTAQKTFEVAFGVQNRMPWDKMFGDNFGQLTIKSTGFKDYLIEPKKPHKDVDLSGLSAEEKLKQLNRFTVDMEVYQSKPETFRNERVLSIGIRIIDKLEGVKVKSNSNYTLNEKLNVSSMPINLTASTSMWAKINGHLGELEAHATCIQGN